MEDKGRDRVEMSSNSSIEMRKEESQVLTSNVAYGREILAT